MATAKKKTDDRPIRMGDLVAHRLPTKAVVKGLKRIPGAALATGSATGHSHRLSPASAAAARRRFPCRRKTRKPAALPIRRTPCPRRMKI